MPSAAGDRSRCGFRVQGNPRATSRPRSRSRARSEHRPELGHRRNSHGYSRCARPGDRCGRADSLRHHRQDLQRQGAAARSSRRISRGRAEASCAPGQSLPGHVRVARSDVGTRCGLRRVRHRLPACAHHVRRRTRRRHARDADRCTRARLAAACRTRGRARQELRASLPDTVYSQATTLATSPLPFRSTSSTTRIPTCPRAQFPRSTTT